MVQLVSLDLLDKKDLWDQLVNQDLLEHLVQEGQEDLMDKLELLDHQEKVEIQDHLVQLDNQDLSENPVTKVSVVTLVRVVVLDLLEQTVQMELLVQEVHPVPLV